MHDTIAIQKLTELINETPGGSLLLPENQKTLSEYVELLKQYKYEANDEERDKLENKILQMFMLKKKDSLWNDFECDGELTDPVLLLIRDKVGQRDLLNSYRAKEICEQLSQLPFKLKLLIERTNTCLKQEKFKPDLKPIVSLNIEKKNEADAYYAVVVIINSHSFIRLTISADKVEERIQRAIRKDIIDIMLRDKHLDFVFHSIRYSITLNLSSYKEARELQEAIHGIRNTPFFTRQGTR